MTLTEPFPTPASAQSLLLMWSRGPDVADWQRSLNEVRADDIAVDGIFGPQTARATREFQQAAGIQVDGIVGPQTRAAMRGGAAPTGNVLNRGDTGPAVRDLQAKLRALKYWVGTHRRDLRHPDPAGSHRLPEGQRAAAYRASRPGGAVGSGRSGRAAD